jgi:hypothetical protein
MLTYETIADLSQPFVKLMNAGEQIIVNNVHGYLQVRKDYKRSVASRNTYSTLFISIVPFGLLFDELAHPTKNHLFRQGMS